MPATVMVRGSCSGRLLWSALRSTSHWLRWNQGSFWHTLFHYFSLSSLDGSAFIVLPLPTGITHRMVQWRTLFFLLFLLGISFCRFPGLGGLRALGMVTLLYSLKHSLINHSWQLKMEAVILLLSIDLLSQFSSFSVEFHYWCNY